MLEILMIWLFVTAALAIAAWFLHNTFTGKASGHNCGCTVCKMVEPEDPDAPATSENERKVVHLKKSE